MWSLDYVLSSLSKTFFKICWSGKKINWTSGNFFISLQVFEKFDHFVKNYQMIRNCENLFFFTHFQKRNLQFHFEHDRQILWLFNAVKRSEKLGMKVLEKENILLIFLPNLSDKLNLIIKQEGVLDRRNLLEFR